MLKLNDKNLKKFENNLKNFSQKSLNYAIKNTINDLAFNTLKNSKEQIQKDFILRNKFTLNSIRVTKAKTDKDVAVVGSVASYMRDQEEGKEKKSKGKEGVPIPTAYAAGQSESQVPRTKKIRSSNWLSKIQLARVKKRSSRKQQAVASIKEAAASGRRYIYLELPNDRKGIFKVIGNKKNSKIKMLYDLSNKTTRIKKTKWLEKSTDKTLEDRDKIYFKRLKEQLRRYQ